MIDTVIECTAGTLQGIDLGNVLVFRGIPYAAPPVGDLRFAAPRPHPGWEGVLPATEFGPAAPQPSAGPLSGLVPGMDPETGFSEDCLTLNVWTPGAGGTLSRKPVLVWFHGGGYALGASSLEIYDGALLAETEDVVVVTVNYRLGLLGFLLLDDETTSANCGILDQVVALRWVKENIEAFGGDADRITVFGESAGGGCVLSLLASPLAAGLFEGAIVQSGASNQFLSRPRAERVAAAVFAELRLAPGDVAGLRAVPSDQLVVIQQDLGMKLLGSVGVMPFAPTDDGAVLVGSWEHARAAGINGDVAMIIGTTADEMRLFIATDPAAATLDRTQLEKRVRGLGLDPDAIINAFGEGASPSDIWWALQTDLAMWMPALTIAELHRGTTQDVWMYRFDWPAAEAGLGACHGVDIPFPFNTVTRAGWDGFLRDPEGATALAARIQHHWAAFARNGEPGWPRFDAINRTTMIFGAGDHLENDPRAERRRALSV